jgi:hypothetical protein
MQSTDKLSSNGSNKGSSKSDPDGFGAQFDQDMLLDILAITIGLVVTSGVLGFFGGEL